MPRDVHSCLSVQAVFLTFVRAALSIFGLKSVKRNAPLCLASHLTAVHGQADQQIYARSYSSSFGLSIRNFNSSDNYCAIHCNMFKYLALRVVGMQLCSSCLAARSRQLVMSSHNIEASPGSVPPGLNKVGEIITTQGLT